MCTAFNDKFLDYLMAQVWCRMFNHILFFSTNFSFFFFVDSSCFVVCNRLMAVNCRTNNLNDLC